jgi:D-alanyl-D-alanine carboxypeptidase
MSTTPALLATARQHLATTAVPGIASTVLIDGEVRAHAATGCSDLAGEQPLATDARFYLYSITKTLTAAIVLRLVADGLLALDDDVREYLPHLPLPATIEVRQVLNHTSGLPDYGASRTYQDAVRRGPEEVWPADEFLAQTLPHGLRFPPGRGWAYSNVGYLLLKLLIECVTGQRFAAAVQTYIAAPLGLRRTSVVETLADQARLTPGYTTFFSDDDTLEDVRDHYHPGWVAHGVVAATALETAQAIDAIVSGNLLTPELRATMLTPVAVPVTHPFFRRPAYGLGVMLDSHSPWGVLAGHGGSGPGYDLGALHATDVGGSRVTAVALANRDVPDAGLRLAHDLIAAAGGEG